MDILRTATDWTKAEVFSSTYFISFGLLFMIVSVGFWHLGKTDVARAYIIPLLVAGALLLVIGLGIFAQSYARITSFATAFDSDAPAFIASEIARAERVLISYSISVFRVIPLIIAVSAVLFVFLDTPTWRAILVSTIAMMAIILLVDTNANARLKSYQERLLQHAQQE